MAEYRRATARGRPRRRPAPRGGGARRPTPSPSTHHRPRRQARPPAAGALHASSAAPARREPPSPRVVRRRRLLLGVLAALALVGFLFAFVYPTRTYLGQRDQIRRAEERLAVLQRQTVTLERDTKRLQGDAEVERIAREQYGLVRPGETPYVIVPPETLPPQTLPPETLPPETLPPETLPPPSP
jgi:cell division protein FtsB